MEYRIEQKRSRWLQPDDLGAITALEYYNPFFLRTYISCTAFVFLILAFSNSSLLINIQLYKRGNLLGLRFKKKVQPDRFGDRDGGRRPLASNWAAGGDDHRGGWRTRPPPSSARLPCKP